MKNNQQRNQKVGTHYKAQKIEKKNEPLEWRETKVMTSGMVRMAIQTAVGYNEKIMISFSLERMPNKPEGRLSKHFRPEDSENIVLLMKDFAKFLLSPSFT